MALNMLDFLIIYELKNRELESVCLLKFELEKRGYTVGIDCAVKVWAHKKIKKKKAKVVVTYCSYGDKENRDCFYFVDSINKIVNLQWEQVYTVQAENNILDIHYPKESSKNVVHICWGRFMSDKLLKECNIDTKYIYETGNIKFDFLQNNVKNYYLCRDKLLSKYGIKKKKVYLFISSFAIGGIPDSYLDDSYTTFKKISIKSQSIIFKWFEHELLLHPDIVLIYRPHPNEIGNNVLKEYSKKFKNFMVINDYSVQQWITVVDKIYTWISTSIAEAYVANKSISILRPIEIPMEEDIRFYHKADIINNFEDFDKKYTTLNINFPVDETILNYYFGFNNKNAYLKVCDTLEKVLNDDNFKYNFNSLKTTENTTTTNIFNLNNVKKLIIGKLFYKNKIKLLKLINKDPYNSKYKEYGYLEELAANNIVNRFQIKKIVRKISSAFK